MAALPASPEPEVIHEHVTEHGFLRFVKDPRSSNGTPIVEFSVTGDVWTEVRISREISVSFLDQAKEITRLHAVIERYQHALALHHLEACSCIEYDFEINRYLAEQAKRP